jgi:short-subunit dehydrogenase
MRMDAKKAVLISGAAMAGAGLLCAGAATAALTVAMKRRPLGLFRGKTVLITGSSRGLGLALAEEFGRRGARLILTARDADELERARTALIMRGVVQNTVDVLAVPSDLRKPEEAEYLITRAVGEFGQIDILINNAGIITVGPVENQTVEDFHHVMESNFYTGLHSTMAALPHMLRRGSGIVVNITSIGGKVAVPHLLPYTASKFAAVGFSQGLHAELRSKGIHVLTVCPGLMRTGSHVNALFSGDVAREYRWFSLSATMPGVSTTAAHAAKRIALAVLLRETEIAITPQAVIASRAGQLAPGITARLMNLASRILPGPVAEPSAMRRGAEVRTRDLPPVAIFGRRAVRRYNQTA